MELNVMMKIRKIRSKLFAVLLLTVLSLTTVYAQQPIINSKSPDNKAELELKIIDKINHLSEVKRLQDEVKKNSGGKRRVFTAIYQRPAGDIKDYWVRVWQDNGECYVGIFNFYVDPGSFEIKYFDADTDKIMDLKKWRKQYKK